MYPYGWTKWNSVAAFESHDFEPSERGQYLYAWTVETAEEAQVWLEDSGGWDGTIYDAELVDATGFISCTERLFSLPKKSSLPDLGLVVRGWVAYEGIDEVSMVGEGKDRWLIIYHKLSSYISGNVKK